MQAEKRGILDTEWSQRDHAAFPNMWPPAGTAGDNTKGKRACAQHGIEAWNPRQAVRASGHSENRQRLGSTVNAAVAHGPRT